MSRFDEIQSELDGGGSYQKAVLQLLCEIVELLEVDKQVVVPFTAPMVSEPPTVKEVVEKTVKKKRGRPKRK